MYSYNFNFSVPQSVQTGSGDHTVSYPMGTTGCFHGGKTADHSPPNIAEVKNKWSYSSSHQYVFIQ